MSTDGLYWMTGRIEEHCEKLDLAQAGDTGLSSFMSTPSPHPAHLSGQAEDEQRGG